MINLARMLAKEYRTYSEENKESTGNKLVAMLDILWAFIVILINCIWFVPFILLVHRVIDFKIFLVCVVIYFIVYAVSMWHLPKEFSSFERYIRNKYRC